MQRLAGNRPAVLFDSGAISNLTGACVPASLGLCLLIMDTPKPLARARRPSPLVQAILILGALLSLITAAGLYLWERNRAQASMAASATRIAQMTRECVNHQIANARLVATLFSVLPDEIGQEQFERIAAFLPSECDTTEGFGWAPRVSAAGRAEFEQTRLNRGSASGIVEFDETGALVRAAKRGEYFPLLYTAAGYPWRPAGFDLGSNARYRQTLVHARNSAKPGFPPASGGGEDSGRFQELFFPAYRPGASLETAAQRQANLRGVVVGVIDMHAVIQRAFAWSGSPPYAVKVFRSNDLDSWQLVHVHPSGGARPELADTAAEVPTRLVKLGEQRWRLQFFRPPGAHTSSPGWLPLGALLGGLIATAFAGLYAQTRKERSESEERHLNALRNEVAERRLTEERFGIALKASAVAVFDQDAALRYTWVQNLCADRSLVGGNDYDLTDTAEDAEHLIELKRRVLSSGLGMREQIKLRIGGVDRFYNLALEPQFGGGGEAVGIIGAVVDVTEHLQLQRRLRQQAKQLAEADRRKDEFLALLAHELRNPLAPISNATQVLKREKPLSEETAAWAEQVIDRQTQQLTRLVNDLLDIARITRGQITLKRRPIDLGEVIAHAVEAAQPLMEERGHELSVGFPVEPLWVEGDRTRLIQVLGNLLDNAAKYTPSRGRIEVLASHMGSDAVVTVRDNGIGIAPDLLPHVFDIFAHARDPDRAAPDGLGLGLNISRSLVEMHQGRVEAISAGEGKGSEFRVFLPTLSVPSAREPEQSPSPRVPPSQGLSVLVVEDSADVAKSFAMLLSALGHQVQVAHDANAGLEIAHSQHVDVAFLDIRMPGMNGYELAKRLRAQYGDELTLVAVTGFGQASDRQRAFESGFDEHLLKPVDPDAIEDILRAVESRAS